MVHARSTLSGFSSHCHEKREPHATHSAVPRQFIEDGGVHSFGALAESHPISGLLSHSAPPSDMVNTESVVWLKHGDSGVAIRYQVNEFTHTWLVEHYITQSHIYPGFISKVSTLTHFPLEPSFEDCYFFGPGSGGL